MSILSFLRKEPTVNERFNKHDTGAFMTPDAPLLGAEGDHFVFIYDDMMFNRSDYPIIESLILNNMGPGLAITYVEAYINKISGRVIAFPPHNGARPAWSNRQGCYKASIRGSVYEINAAGIILLDSLYGNNVYCHRSRVLCDLWKKRSRPPSVHTAWIYLGIPDKWEIDGGYEWQSLNINPHNYWTAEDHYYHSTRRSPLVPQIL